MVRTAFTSIANTCQLICLTGRNGTNANIPPDVRIKLSPPEVLQLELGSKYLISGWVFYCTGLWCMKACVLVFYSRLVFRLPLCLVGVTDSVSLQVRGLWQQTVVKYVSYACVGTYIGSILTIFLHCTPLHKQWQVVPDPGGKATKSRRVHDIERKLTKPADRCTLPTINTVIIGAFNIA